MKDCCGGTILYMDLLGSYMNLQGNELPLCAHMHTQVHMQLEPPTVALSWYQCPLLVMRELGKCYTSLLNVFLSVNLLILKIINLKKYTIQNNFKI